MSDAIEVTTAVKFKRWQVPNYAVQDMPPRPKQDGMRELPKMHVSELPVQVIDALAEAWLADLYANAAQRNPFAGRAVPLEQKGAKA